MKGIAGLATEGKGVQVMTTDRAFRSGAVASGVAPLSLVRSPPIWGIARNVDPRANSATDSDMDTMRVLVLYRAYLGASYAAKTCLSYERTIIRFWRARGLAFNEVSEQDAAEWLEGFEYRSSARRTYYQALVVFYTWAVRNGHMDHNPVEGIRVPPVLSKEARALSEEEYTAVLVAASRRSAVRACAIAFLYHSGCRLNEMLNVRWDDLHPDGVLLRKTKTGKERKIPWSDGLRGAVEGLRRQFGECEYILPRSAQTVWSWCRTAGTEAGVPNVHPHLFRSTAASTMLKRGARLHAVRTVLGHDNVKTTSRYLSDELEDREAAVQLL